MQKSGRHVVLTLRQGEKCKSFLSFSLVFEITEPLRTDSFQSCCIMTIKLCDFGSKAYQQMA